MEGYIVFGWRVGKIKQVFPRVENQYLAIGAKGFPHMSLAPELLTTGLVQTICEFKNLVKVKREKRE